MRKVSFILILITITIISSQADVFFEFQPEVVDARASALGRTTVLTTSGSNTLFTNPAGLSLLKIKTLQAGMRFNFGSKTQDYESTSYPQTVNHEFSYPFHVKVNHVSYAIPVRFKDLLKNCCFAVGYRTLYDQGYNENDETEEFPGREMVTYDREYNGGFNTLTLGMGFELMKDLRVGFSYNFGILSSNYYEKRGHFYLATSHQMKQDYSYAGDFFSWGMIYKVNKKLDIGLTYRPVYEIEYEYKFGRRDSFYEKYYITYQIPEQWSLSASYSISKIWKVILEYQPTNFVQYEADDKMLWISSKQGASYHVATELNIKIPVRLGFFCSDLPNKEEYKYSTASQDCAISPIHLIGFTAGSSWKLNDHLIMDISAEYAYLKVEEENAYYKNSTFLDRYRIGTTLTWNIESK